MYFIKHFSLILFISLMFMSCGEGNDTQDITENTNKRILSFDFLPENNTDLEYYGQGEINDNTREITVEIVGDVDVSNLAPTISISGIDISPKSNELQDFSSQVKYIVTAEDGSTSEYTVSLKVISNNNELYSFIFEATRNSGISEDIVATINEENKRISALLPHGVDIKSLTPTLTYSEKAVSDPASDKPYDFEFNPRYSIVSEAGLRNNYDIDIKSEISEKELNVLRAIVNANPNNLLEWDLTGYYSDSWLNVLGINKFGFITQLNFNFTDQDYKTTTFPDEITDLEYLKSIDIRDGIRDLRNFPVNTQNMVNLERISIYYADFQELPKGITNLPNLKQLTLTACSILKIPDAISNLTQLERLTLNRSSISEVSSEIGKLTNLKSLSMNNNSTISVFPEELGSLVNLSYLDLSYCGLTSIPRSIKNLQNLENLNLKANKLNNLPEELAFLLVALTELNLSFNDLTELPAWISDLSKLQTLEIYGNLFTTIPQIVCDLEISGTVIKKNINVGCE